MLSMFFNHTITDHLRKGTRPRIRQININHCWGSVPIPVHIHTYIQTLPEAATKWAAPLEETHTDSGYPLFIHGSQNSLALHSSFTSPQGVGRLANLALCTTPPTGWSQLHPDLTQCIYGPVTLLGLGADRATVEGRTHQTQQQQ